MENESNANISAKNVVNYYAGCSHHFTCFDSNIKTNHKVVVFDLPNFNFFFFKQNLEQK